jgi:hypothetical protein
MSGRHNFIAQTMQNDRSVSHLAHGDNAVAFFFYCSGYQVDQKH